MDTLLDLEVDPSEAYNVVPGTHNVAGKSVIAAMDAKFAETNARIESLGAELRIQKWILGLLVALVGMLMTAVVALFLHLLSGYPAPSEATVATAVAEELEPRSARPRPIPKIPPSKLPTKMLRSRLLIRQSVADTRTLQIGLAARAWYRDPRCQRSVSGRTREADRDPAISAVRRGQVALQQWAWRPR